MTPGRTMVFQETKPSNQENKNVKPSKMYLHITSIPTSTTLTTSTTSISSSLVNIHTSPNLQPQVYAQYGLCPGHGSARKSWRSEDMRPPRWAKRRSPPSPDAWPTINVRLRFLTNQVDRCCPYLKKNSLCRVQKCPESKYQWSR